MTRETKTTPATNRNCRILNMTTLQELPAVTQAD
jgi:hypothetical protein